MHISTTHIWLFVLISLFYKSSSIRHRYYWRDYRGKLPVDAVNVTKFLYIGQVIHGGVLVGGFYAGTGAVIVESDGKRAVAWQGIKLLCDRRKKNFHWEPVKSYMLSPNKLQNMVAGGFEDGIITYIGKTFHEGEWKIGQVFPPPHYLEGLHVWRNDRGRAVIKEFDILRYLDRYV